VEEVRRQVGETIYARDVSVLELQMSDAVFIITFPHQMVDDAKNQNNLMPVWFVNSNGSSRTLCMQKVDKMFAAFTGQPLDMVQQWTERDRFMSSSEVSFLPYYIIGKTREKQQFFIFFFGP